jgi:predicted HicB family RNase H-like nuclease
MNESRKAVNLRPKIDKVSWKQQTIRIPADVHKALKVQAAEEGKPVAQVIEALVRAWLQQGARP